MEKLIDEKNEETVSSLHPASLWQHFLMFCSIPHGSKKEEEVADYIVNIALKYDYACCRDALHNVLVSIPATEGFEHIPPICLQGHIDMVLDKDAGVEEQFPIELLLLEDGTVTANGTTLGADNGIGAAAMLAVMETDFSHGPIELLFTTQEEIGLIGAKHFDFSRMKSKRVLNLDSEEEGVLFVGCAGGARVQAVLDHLQQVPLEPAGMVKCVVEISGLIGGHSGLEIHHNRANAIKILASAISHVHAKTRIRLGSISGGSKMNAIPNYAQAVLFVEIKNRQDFSNALFDFINELEEKYPDEKIGCLIEDHTVISGEQVFSSTGQAVLLHLIDSLPHGVIEREEVDPSMIRTSNNVGVIKTESGIVTIDTMFRSSSKDEIQRMEKLVCDIFASAGATTIVEKYPPWEPRFDGELLMTVRRQAEKILGFKPKIETIHAGLECSIIAEKVEQAEIVSFGPTIRGAHTTKEWVHTKSVELFWNLLLAVISVE